MACAGYVGAVFLGVLGMLLASGEAQLVMDFYKNTCPRAESIVNETVVAAMKNAPSLAAPLIRMHFHDCFVRGCDGSVLLNSTKASNQSEKLAVPNQTVRGFNFIDRVKAKVEDECPGTVSCADILALVARDAIVATHGPFWHVSTGRRDGTTSNAAEALNLIPPPTSNISTLISLFGNVGLNLTDLVLLSGAHTIGVSHCPSLSNRLYNFTGRGDQDPALDSEYAANLKQYKCRSINDNTTLLEMDPGSRKTFDRHYYDVVVKRRGLFQSDSALLNNNFTRSLVNQLAQGSLQNFYAAFARSMEKMSQANVMTGSNGEIRRHCAMVN